MTIFNYFPNQYKHLIYRENRMVLICRLKFTVVSIYRLFFSFENKIEMLMSKKPECSLLIYFQQFTYLFAFKCSPETSEKRENVAILYRT